MKLKSASVVNTIRFLQYHKSFAHSIDRAFAQGKRWRCFSEEDCVALMNYGCDDRAKWTDFQHCRTKVMELLVENIRLIKTRTRMLPKRFELTELHQKGKSLRDWFIKPLEETFITHYACACCRD